MNKQDVIICAALQLITACKQYCLAAGATQGNIAYTENVMCHFTETPQTNKNKFAYYMSTYYICTDNFVKQNILVCGQQK